MSDLSAAVERAAEAMFHADYGLGHGEWPDVAWGFRVEYRARGEAALQAALPVIEQMHRAAHAEEFAEAIEAQANLAWTAYTSGKPVDSDLLAAASEGMVDAFGMAAALVRSLAAAKETTE